MATVVKIMRGIPGSGKSTYARQNWPLAVFCSADDYYVNPKTKLYEFKRENASEAHNYCLKRFMLALQTNIGQTIVVDNTNVRVFEIAPYYRIAEAMGYDVEIIWLHADPVEAAKRTIHGVPPETVHNMAVSFEPLPNWWKVRIV